MDIAQGRGGEDNKDDDNDNEFDYGKDLAMQGGHPKGALSEIGFHSCHPNFRPTHLQQAQAAFLER
jgi:hypothetical protein